ncbi:hypothetical protein M426DRAFT_117234 [Hypoxylon sp. CI-4A]|nr:hypothetical protein M426DRAFT_117234 [Hypoxylon sp. CI-4A]
MSDPLSIAAAVAGLLQLSASVYQSISKFIAKLKNAPLCAYDLRLTLFDMRLALGSISHLIDSFQETPPRRKAMVQLDHLILCITQSVLVFSNLERFVNIWAERAQSSLWQKWRFINQEEKLKEFNIKIQQQKISLNLVLSVLSSESDIDAQKSVEALHEKMEDVLVQNKHLQNSVAVLSNTVRSSVYSHSILTTIREGDEDSRASTIRNAHTKTNGYDQTTKSSSHTTRTNSTTGGKRARQAWSSLLGDKSLLKPFETDLLQSTVYSRARSHECDVSFTTNQSKSALWSLLSGLSLGEISNISVIALPISINDIWNSSWYKANLLAPTSPEATYKILVLGCKGVGKTALIARFRYGVFIPSNLLNGSCSISLLRELDIPCRIEIIDTPGTDSPDALTSRNIKEADGFIIAYSIMDSTTARSLHALHDRIREVKGSHWLSDRCVIVGTKSDLAVGPEQSHAGAATAMNFECPFFECSAKTGEHVRDCFIEICRNIRKRDRQADDICLQHDFKSQARALLKDDLQPELHTVIIENHDDSDIDDISPASKRPFSLNHPSDIQLEMLHSFQTRPEFLHALRLEYYSYPWGTPLHVAIWRSDFEAIETLLGAGADLFAGITAGDYPCPITLAARTGSRDILKIIRHGNQLKGSIKHQWHPEHILVEAASYGHVSVVNKLLRQRDLELYDPAGTALYRAASSWQAKVVELLVDKVLYPPSYINEAFREALETFSKERISNATRNPKDSHITEITTSWHKYQQYRASTANTADITGTFEVLLKKGGDPNTRDHRGQTALHYLAGLTLIEHGSALKPSSIQYLLARGAQATIADKEGETPLHRAAYNSKDPIFQLYLHNCNKGSELGVCIQIHLIILIGPKVLDPSCNLSFLNILMLV